MKTIEERAKQAQALYKDESRRTFNSTHHNFTDWEYGYCQGATEQKAIDDAEIERLKAAWSKEAKITHNDEMNYRQGFHDAKDITICKACSWICDNCEVEHCEFDGGSKCPTLKSLREYMER